MNKLIHLGLLLNLCLLNPIYSGEIAEDFTRDLDGRWEIVEMVIDGQKTPVESFKEPWYFDISGSGVAWTHHLVMNNKPHDIDLRAVIRSGNELIEINFRLTNTPLFKSIARRNGNEMELCICEVKNQLRPTEMKSTPNSRTNYYRLKRVAVEN